MRAVRLAVLAALVLVSPGCGTKEKAASGAAELAPSSAAAFVSIDTRVEGDQWENVRSLVRKFPDGDRALEMLRTSFENDTGISWERDLKPALGDEVGILWLDFRNSGENLVALVKPRDKEKLRRAIAKGNASDDGEDLLIGEHGEWFVIAETQDKIDRFEELANGDSLAEDDSYKTALEELPESRLVTAFAGGPELLQALRATGVGDLDSLFKLGGQGELEHVAAALIAEDNGTRLITKARATQAGKTEASPYESRLLGDVPADALAFFSFRGGETFEQQLQGLENDASYQELLREFEQELGFRLDRVTRLFKNEVALYVRQASPIPEFTLLLEAADEEEALDAVDDVLSRIARELPAQPCHAPTEEAGVKVECIGLDEFTIRYAGFDDKVVVTTGAGAIRELRSGDDKLEDSQSFKDARARAGLPEKNSGFLWVDLEELVPMLLGFAELSGADAAIPAEVHRNLDPLRSIVGWAVSEGRTGSAELFVEID